MKASLSTVVPFLFASANALAMPKDGVASLISARSSSLKWSPCDLDLGDDVLAIMAEDTDCATLEVPLDYTDSKSSKTIDLQLIRTKATKKPFKGSVLYNPGGPGGSGVEAVAASGPEMRDILGGQFNIIGFDPRGTGRTIPFACDFSEGSNSTTSRRSVSTFSQMDAWASVEQAWDSYGLIADACYESQKEYGRFLGTPFVARDMISIVDALGEDGKLRYWGTSYGTILGQVAVSMFPDRLDRVLLDSTLLAETYATTAWSSSSRDLERAFLNFLDECVEAGPQQCLLANYSGPATTAQDLQVAVEDFITEWLDKPTVPGYSKETLPLGGESLVQNLKMTISQLSYNPVNYPILGAVVYYTLQNDFERALAAIPEGRAEHWNQGTHSIFGIRCADSTFRADSVDDLYSLTQVHLAQGSFADAGADNRLGCARWKFETAEKIDTNKLHNVKTSFPVLFVNGMYDPVTPLEDAWEASSRFRKSRVLVHGGVGHSFMNHPSNCTNNAVQEYFVDGKLPELGTFCKPNESAFGYVADLVASQNTTSNE